MKKFDKTPTTLTKEPIAMTGAVVGFKYKDGVILAADTQGSYGSMARFKNITRIHRVAPTTAMASGGELSDFQEIKRILDEKHEHDLIQDDGTLFYQPHDYAHFLARKHYQRRNKGDPLWNNTVMGGVSSTGEKYLAVMDLFGNIIEGDHHVTGTGHYFCNVLIANNWREDMSFEEAKELVDNCFRVLFYRDKTMTEHIQICAVTKDGVNVSEPYTIQGKWDYEAFVKNTNERVRDMLVR